MKKKAAYTPQPRYTYTLMDVLTASTTHPMPEEKRKSQLLRMYGGLAAIERGENPGSDDWAVCSDAVNLMETLVLTGIVADEQGLIMDGITALAMAGRRAASGHQIRLDGVGIAAMRAILEDYAALLETLSDRIIIECHRKTERRIHEILAGKSKPHDVEIITGE